MGRVRNLKVENYRSISDPVEIRFPAEAPVILVGENNAGKSNIVRALDIIAGESWPGSYAPEDHDFFNRDRRNTPMIISAER